MGTWARRSPKIDCHECRLNQPHKAQICEGFYILDPFQLAPSGKNVTVQWFFLKKEHGLHFSLQQCRHFFVKKCLQRYVYKSQFEEDKVILKRAKCSDQEWMEYEEKVESEMEMAELLDDLGGRV